MDASTTVEAKTVRCQKIEIVDQYGKCRIMMYAESDKSVILLMGDKNPAIQISSSNTNPAEMHFMDAAAAGGLTLGLFGNGDAGLIIRDQKGRPMVTVGYKISNGKGEIRCNGEILHKGQPKHDGNAESV